MRLESAARMRLESATRMRLHGQRLEAACRVRLHASLMEPHSGGGGSNPWRSSRSRTCERGWVGGWVGGNPARRAEIGARQARRPLRLTTVSFRTARLSVAPRRGGMMTPTSLLAPPSRLGLRACRSLRAPWHRARPLVLAAQTPTCSAAGFAAPPLLAPPPAPDRRARLRARRPLLGPRLLPLLSLPRLGSVHTARPARPGDSDCAPAGPCRGCARRAPPAPPARKAARTG